MPPKSPWKHQTIKLINQVLDVLHPVDQVDENHFSRMEDVKSLQEGDITPRPGTGLLNVTPLESATPVITATDMKNHGDGSNATGYTSGGGNIPFVNNRLYLASVFAVSQGGGPISGTTCSGGNLTWVIVEDAQFKTIASPNACVTVFRALVTGGAGSANLTFNLSTTAQTGLMQLWEFTGVDLTGTNGSGAIVQSDTFASDSTAASLITLSAFGSGIHATFGAFSDGEQTGTLVAGSGFTNATMPSATTLAEWVNVADTTVDCTRTGAVDMGGVAIEIRKA